MTKRSQPDAGAKPAPNRGSGLNSRGPDKGPAGSARIRHALRTPINHILGYCEMLIEEGGTSESFQRDLERIRGGGRQLLSLIGRHFSESGWEEGSLDLHRLHHDLRTPVNCIVGYCELLQEEEAAEAGQTRFIPELKKIHAAAHTWLALMEESLGIQPPSNAGPGRDPGTPLANAGAAGLDQSPPAPAMKPAKRMRRAGASLLIVDDDQDNRVLLARRLQRLGYQVTLAANGQEAIDLIHGRKLDLVLLDLVMPGLGGIEVLKRVRQRRSASKLPIIMLTALDSSAEVVEALRLGASDYVTKPAEFAILLARTETQLRLKRAQERLRARIRKVRKLAGSLEKHVRFIRQVFGRYVTEAVVQSLLETPEGLKLGGEKREVTILMCDLRGFTPIAERLPPEQTVEMLNVYLGEMTTVISQYDGVIDGFIGDAILASFGALIHKEDHAQRAVACALAMQRAMVRVNEQLPHMRATPLTMGIGINTGQVVVGNIGSTQRAKFGVIGSPVNIVSRIQATAAGGEVLLTEATLSHVGPLLSFREKRTLLAKGVTEPLTLYVVESIGGDYGGRPR